jgi:hypothetical protein
VNATHLVALIRAEPASNAGNWSSVPPPSRHGALCTMTDHHFYGTSSHTATELVRLVSDLLGPALTACDSDYRGVCR